MALYFKLSRKTIAFTLCTVLVLYVFIYKNLPSDSFVSENIVQQADLKKTEGKMKGPITKENLSERLTIIIREFENFDNALETTVENIVNTLGDVEILIIADLNPYPPVRLNPVGKARIVTLSSNLMNNYTNSCPLQNLKTDYVFVIPDGVKIKDWQFMKSAITFLRSKRNTKAVAIPISDQTLECAELNIDYKRWTLSFQGNNSSMLINECPLIKGKHSVLMESSTMKSLTEPLARPFPFSFYVQARLKKWNIRIMKSARMDVIKNLYTDAHSNWKHKRAETERLHSFYNKVGIKRVILATGLSMYYGCDKSHSRCFGSVINDMPDYLFDGRWTPPCCLKALRETAVHVFTTLENCGVRYWLEGGSLLGAARNKDIIPWDYDVDIGIYKEDIEKCLPLTEAKRDEYIDEQDFVWEKANEGDFYRVQFSDVNHLHVDIYPFYPKDGIMTKDTWFPTHRQDVAFPEEYLKPLIKIEFVGMLVNAPNNVKRFLEYKFGDGVIENPRYPNYQRPL